MHGLGNDFVVFNAIDQQVSLSPDQLRFIADRHFGIGCDQILFIEAPREEDTDFFYRIFNADGGEVEQCGNGARCFARFVREKGLSSNDIIHVGTMLGRITLYIEDDGQVRVNMGIPKFDPKSLPFDAEDVALTYSLDVDGENFDISAISMGNPHAVLLVKDVDTAAVQTLGPKIESHTAFPQRVNVGFMAIKNPANIDLRVYERGSGETLACGTGACAAVVAGIQRELLKEEVRVKLRGGDLVISWKGDNQPVWMTGPAVQVYDGTIDL